MHNVLIYPRSMTKSEGWQQAQVARIAEAIRELRGTRSVQWLSDQTEELGLRVNRSTIADFELGRRKYVAVHEISLIAAALGVTPATLLTWGTVPDGEVDVLPGRAVSGLDAVDWWGGAPLSPLLASVQGLPRDPTATDLIGMSRLRAETQSALVRPGIATPGGGSLGPDPALVPLLKDRLKGLVTRIRDLGGVIKGGDDA